MIGRYRRPASRMLALCLVLAGGASAQAGGVWMRLFDGKGFQGWQGKTMTDWKIDSTGAIVGTHVGLTPAMGGENTFLFTDSLFSDFELRLEGRMPGSGGYRNSGIMYRSTIASKTSYSAAGYQYEISDGGTGAFYHERGSELGFQGGCREATNASEWKKMAIIADGAKAQHFLNGKSCFTYSNFKVTAKGYIAVQLHAPGDFTVNFRNIFIRPLNNSFVIPPGNAWDSTGKQLNITGNRIVPKSARFDAVAYLPGNAALIDARGRFLRPASRQPGAELRMRRPDRLLIAR